MVLNPKVGGLSSRPFLGHWIWPSTRLDLAGSVPPLTFASPLLPPLPAAEPLPLMELCRRSVRVSLGKDRLSKIHALPLPEALKSYLLYQ